MDVIRIVNTDKLEPGTIRIPKDKEKKRVGGKGIDVTRAIEALGEGRVSSTAVVCLGGHTGKIIYGRLLADGIRTEPIWFEAETRTNVILIDNKKREYRFNVQGPPLPESTRYELFDKILKLPDSRRDLEAVTISGSQPDEWPNRGYITMIHEIKDKDCYVAVDTSGEALRESLSTKPYPDLIKPNFKEFYELTGKEELDHVKSLKRYLDKPPTERDEEFEKCWAELIRDLVIYYKEKSEEVTILLSVGKFGILAISKGHDRIIHAYYPNEDPKEAKIISTVGAGDVVLGTYLLKRVERKEDFKETIQFAAAASLERCCTGLDFELLTGHYFSKDGAQKRFDSIKVLEYPKREGNGGIGKYPYFEEPRKEDESQQ